MCEVCKRCSFAQFVNSISYADEYDKYEITADDDDGEITEEEEARVAAAEELLAFMLNNSMITVHVPIQIIAKEGRGLGIFTKVGGLDLVSHVFPHQFKREP